MSAVSRSNTDPYRIAGIATRSEVAKAASEVALLRRAGHLRPSLDKPRPKGVGYRIGASRDTSVWASVEDSILLIGPPRSGKGAHIVIKSILEAPGAVVTTSTRPKNLTATLRARQEIGPVAVFDPQHLAEGLPAGLRWSPIRGCEDPLTATIRATGLAAGTGLSAGGVEGGGLWEDKTRTALQALLHAAALDHRPPSELLRWPLDPSAAADAVAILTANPRAATGWSDSLQAMIDSGSRTRDSIWQGVSLALAALADPRVLDAVSPREAEDFDPEAFLRHRGTLYLLATGADANNSAALVAAFVEEVVEAARRLAATGPGARLDPPLLPALDEVGNLAPLPSLPTLMAGRRNRDHDHAGASVARAGAGEVVGERGRRDLGRLHRQDRPRRSVELRGPARPHHAHRRARRDDRLHHGRRPRLPLRTTLHPPRADHAARHDPHPPIRDCTGAVAPRATHRHPDADLDRPARRERAAR